MKKQIKFVDGVYGFIYDSVHGYVSKVFRDPISEIELKAINKVIGSDDLVFVVGNENDIVEMWDLENYPNLNELDINEGQTILEWEK